MTASPVGPSFWMAAGLFILLNSAFWQPSGQYILLTPSRPVRPSGPQPGQSVLLKAIMSFSIAVSRELLAVYPLSYLCVPTFRQWAMPIVCCGISPLFYYHVVQSAGIWLGLFLTLPLFCRLSAIFVFISVCPCNRLCVVSSYYFWLSPLMYIF